MGTLVTLAVIALSGLGVGNSFECETDEVSLCASKEDKTCVNKKVACSGNFLCEDKTDLDWCKKKEKRKRAQDITKGVAQKQQQQQMVFLGNAFGTASWETKVIHAVTDQTKTHSPSRCPPWISPW